MSLENIKKQIDILRLQIEKLIADLRNKEFNKTIPNLPKPEYIIVHHGGGEYNFYQVNKHHIELWGMISSLGFGCGYQYFIEYSGLVYNARRDTEEGAHTVGPLPNYYNRSSIGMCLQGNANLKPPTQSQLNSLDDLIGRKQEQYGIPNNKILGHKEVSLYSTDCPGKHLWKWLCEHYPSMGRHKKLLKNV